MGVVPQQRGGLYHRLFSSEEKEFVSGSLEVQQMLRPVSQAIAPLKERLTVRRQYLFSKFMSAGIQVFGPHGSLLSWMYWT